MQVGRRAAYAWQVLSGSSSRMMVRHLKPWRMMPTRRFSSSVEDHGTSFERSRTFSSFSGAVSLLYRLRTDESDLPVASLLAMRVHLGPTLSTSSRMVLSSASDHGSEDDMGGVNFCRSEPRPHGLAVDRPSKVVDSLDPPLRRQVSAASHELAGIKIFFRDGWRIVIRL